MAIEALFLTIFDLCSSIVLTFLIAGVYLLLVRVAQFVCFDALHPSQQFFSHARTISCLPGLNQYLAVDIVSCSRS